MPSDRSIKNSFKEEIFHEISLKCHKFDAGTINLIYKKMFGIKKRFRKYFA